VSQQGPATLLAPVSVAYCRAASLCQHRADCRTRRFSGV